VPIDVVFDGAGNSDDLGANRRQRGVIHIYPDPEARQQARDDFVAFLSAAFTVKSSAQPVTA
jgi:hypothetical protein